ncbi:hypothetical protein ABZ714_11515 [Streptomyces sp. NPDC006798]|uniref:hypothetical protein n=1 Tax=Streptomyces sp. NPDC006798 TaxID=3155462 RepID=UPI0033FC4865
MSYGYGPHFEADPARLSAFISEARTLAQRLKRVANDFPATVEPTSMWYGINDDYAQETGPQAEREFRYVMDGLNLVAKGFEGSVEGHFAALRKINSTQSENLDDIGRLGNGPDPLSGGGGGGPGGGKH